MSRHDFGVSWQDHLACDAVVSNNVYAGVDVGAILEEDL